jgi:hypothetical protein
MSEKLLTRRGARSLTAAMDRIATVIQNNPDVLGIDPKIALDFARRTDLLSDAIETTATVNFPARTADATNEEDLSLPSEGFDPQHIGEEEPGPLEQIDSDEPFMSGHFTQERFHELGEKEEAGVLLPMADKFAALLNDFEQNLTPREAASKMPDVLVQGYDGFVDQVRAISPLVDRIEKLKAEIEAAAGPLLKEKAALDKEYATAVKEVTDTYKDKLTEISNVTIVRKTKLVEAQAMLKVVATKRTLNDVQTEMLAAVAARYGEEVAAFIQTTQSALQDIDKNMRITVQGFELEQRAKTAAFNGVRVAGLADMLGKFRSLLERGWKKIVSVAQAAASMVMGAAAKVEKRENEFFKALDNVPKMASQNDKFAGFDLFA